MLKNMVTNKKQRGFTLIEVILVLAVGSLIFAMAFIAYGQASKNRRDSQRRSDLGKIAQELENYASDNNGKYPAGDAAGQAASSFVQFLNDYVPSIKDPSSQKLYKEWLGNDAANNTPGRIIYYPEQAGGFGYLNTNVKFCDNTTSFPSGSQSVRDYVIRMKLESGEACKDSRQ